MAPKRESSDGSTQIRGLLAYVKSLAVKPFHIIFSKTAQRAYLTTALIFGTSLSLLALSITAYTLFYWTYIPRIGFERNIYLQFDNVYSLWDNRHHVVGRDAHPYPYGSVSLAPDVVGAQQYDVFIELVMPRTSVNIEAGNFMLEVNFFSPKEKGASSTETVHPGISPDVTDRAAIASSRRPAILPYRSSLVELAHKVTGLHWYLLNLRQEADRLMIVMFESVEFGKGWRNVPSTLKLEIQSTRHLQIYSAKAIFRARFKGLRWMMYNHRIASAVVFICGFWTTEMLFAGIAWLAITAYVLPSSQDVNAEEIHKGVERIKREPTDESGLASPKLSDTERTFPTLSSQKMLRYSSSMIKQEERESPIVPIAEAVPPATEADDEDDDDEDEDYSLDSGLGTSMESSSSRRESIRRRRGRLSLKEEG